MSPEADSALPASTFSEPRWLPAKASAFDDIPANSIVESYGTDSDGVIELSYASWDDRHVGVTGPEAIPRGTYGRVSFDYPLWVRPHAATPIGDWSVGNLCGIATGSDFGIRRSVGGNKQSGFACIGVGTSLVYIIQDPLALLPYAYFGLNLTDQSIEHDFGIDAELVEIESGVGLLVGSDGTKKFAVCGGTPAVPYANQADPAANVAALAAWAAVINDLLIEKGFMMPDP